MLLELRQKMQEKVSASRLHHSIAHVLKHLTMLLSYTFVCAGIRKHSAKFVVCMTLTIVLSNLSPLLSQFSFVLQLSFVLLGR